MVLWYHSTHRSMTDSNSGTGRSHDSTADPRNGSGWGSSATEGRDRRDDGTGTDRICADGGTRWTDLTGFQRDLLKSIRRCSRHDQIPTGQTIKEDIEERYGESVTNGRLYQNLNYLVEVDLLSKGFVDGRTNTYHLTQTAEEMLDETVHRFADYCGIEIAPGSD